MAYGFARQPGGDLRVESAVGVGTTIRLYLPRAPDGAAPAQVAAEAGAAPLDPGGNETILLADDNPTLRDVTRRHLIALGYHVSVAANGPAALGVLRSDEMFDLLFTDMVMPGGMSGYDLAEAARRLRPGLKLLFTTGYASDLSGEVDGQHDRQPVLRKPYRRHTLAEAVRSVLDAQ
ncbi:MAG TPA: response regulator [Acetobacteraceae bacterium]|nr:response regulator [Acetobacteraceae bacterium]